VSKQFFIFWSLLVQAVDLFKLACHEFVDKVKYNALSLLPILIHPTLPVCVCVCVCLCVFVNLACQKCKKKVFYLNIKHDVKPTSLTAMQERLNLFLIYFVSKQNFDENKNCRLLQKKFLPQLFPTLCQKNMFDIKIKMSEVFLKTAVHVMPATF